MMPFYEVGERPVFLGPICDHPFPLHVHMVVEVVHLLQGSLTLTVDGNQYVLSPGDTVACFPSVPHGYDAMSEDAQGLCFIFEADTISEFASAFRSSRPVVPFLKADTAGQGLHDSIAVLVKILQEENSPLLMGYLHVFLAHMLSVMPLEPIDSNLDGDLIQQTLQYVSEHFAEDLSLDSVASALGVSKPHLSRLFSNYLKVNFRKYINTLRIDEACTLLRTTGTTVTDICYACGFNNPRTFHRAFMEEKGMQPKDYRALKEGPKVFHQSSVS